MSFDPRDARRAVLASLLQTVWGVSPSYAFWNPYRQEVEADYLWTIGLTPFGYFSSALNLSFSQRDAA